jgi:hypothetical protein
MTELGEQYGIKYEKFVPDFYVSLLSTILKEESTFQFLKKYQSKWNELTGMIVEDTDFIPIKNARVENSKRKNELTNLFTSGKIDELIERLNECTFNDDNTRNNFLLLCEQYNTWQSDNIIGINDNKSLEIKIKKGLLQVIREIA